MLLAVIEEDPFFCLVIGVGQRERYRLHVSAARSDVGAVDEFKAHRFRVGGNDFHARLITGSAVMRHQKAVAHPCETW